MRLYVHNLNWKSTVAYGTGRQAQFSAITNELNLFRIGGKQMGCGLREPGLLKLHRLYKREVLDENVYECECLIIIETMSDRETTVKQP